MGLDQGGGPAEGAAEGAVQMGSGRLKGGIGKTVCGDGEMAPRSQLRESSGWGTSGPGQGACEPSGCGKIWARLGIFLAVRCPGGGWGPAGGLPRASGYPALLGYLAAASWLWLRPQVLGGCQKVRLPYWLPRKQGTGGH